MFQSKAFQNNGGKKNSISGATSPTADVHRGWKETVERSRLQLHLYYVEQLYWTDAFQLVAFIGVASEHTAKLLWPAVLQVNVAEAVRQEIFFFLLTNMSSPFAVCFPECSKRPQNRQWLTACQQSLLKSRETNLTIAYRGIVMFQGRDIRWESFACSLICGRCSRAWGFKRQHMAIYRL